MPSDRSSNQGRSGGSSSSSKSEAARKMRSDDPRERSEGASELGREGGRQRGKNSNR